MEKSSYSDKNFSEKLYVLMQQINPGVQKMELYEFRYSLNNITPEEGWDKIKPDPAEAVETMVNSREFYDSIRIKPKVDGRIVLDPQVLALTRKLMAGLVLGEYRVEWINRHFYFDIRGFIFLHRTTYFTDRIRNRFGGTPLVQFEKKQENFQTYQDLGYQDFKEANSEVDEVFIRSILKLIEVRGTPILVAIAGPTAAGKTEIADRLQEAFRHTAKKIALIELDNFLTDREERELKGIFTQGKEALHFDLLLQSLRDICSGKEISIPRYDFINATSSHDNSGNLKPGGVPIEIKPADIIFIEGNFPFLIQEVGSLISVKVVYLTDDPVRMKRKWKRDIDYRKKYDPAYYCNRYFKDQFIMAEIAYRPQLEICDIAVDTTGSALWVTPETAEILSWE